jgi:hypothetical protein
MFGSQQDLSDTVGNLNAQNVWQEIPDDVLDELYNQLESSEKQKSPMPSHNLFEEVGLSSSGLHFGGGSQNFLAISQGSLTFQYGGLNSPIHREGSGLSVLEPRLLATETLSEETTTMQTNNQNASSPPRNETIMNNPNIINNTNANNSISGLVSPPIVEVQSSLKEIAANQAKKTPDEIHQDVWQPSSKEIEDLKRAHRQLNDLKIMCDTQQSQIEDMKKIQFQCLTKSNAEVIRRLQDNQTKINDNILIAIRILSEIIKNVILDAPGLALCRYLFVNFQKQQQCLELLRQELVNLCERSSRKSVCSLVITDQPLPQVVFKGKQIEEPYTVSLLTGASRFFDEFSHVKAIMVTADTQNPYGDKETIENNEKPLDLYEYHAVFEGIKVNVSTRMTMVSFKFGLQIKSDQDICVVESPPSYPFIVITNESQWAEAAGKLLIADCFAGPPGAPLQVECPWPQYANTLHSHFLKATHQNPNAPLRPLQPYEFHYFHQKFFGEQQIINEHQAQLFWDWFGQVLQTIRFKRHIHHMWQLGLIYGFLTKEEAIRALNTQGLGTFLIRFSETSPGVFAISHVFDDRTQGDKIKHFLVKSEDIGSNKSLPDLLREKDQFQYLLRIDPVTGKLKRQSKDEALSQYYSKRKAMQPTKGYYILS